MLKITYFQHFFDDFQHFFNIFFNIFFSTFFWIFELAVQCSLKWSLVAELFLYKWASYRGFTKSILPSSQVENVTAYHPSTIYNGGQNTTMSQFQVAIPPKWFSYIKQLQKSKNQLPRTMGSASFRQVLFCHFRAHFTM